MFSFTSDDHIVNKVKRISNRLDNTKDLDLIMKEIGDSRFVLLGEASHGTHEYYTWRAELSKRLISEKGFNMIAVEGDWPDCYHINRYIKGYKSSGTNARQALGTFNRWPSWMWANEEMVPLVEWLKKNNDTRSEEDKTGFYGLDVYSLWESMEAIFGYVREKDPKALKSLQEAMDCFEPYNVKEGISYADRNYGLSSSCEQEVQKVLRDLRNKPAKYTDDPESAFSAEQNALVAVNAERYYKDMLAGGDRTWNIRDRHMAETVDRLMKFKGEKSKIIIWEHNTHIGDARATDMKNAGLINIGQLVKQSHDAEGVFRIGFGSYQGTVLAAKGWGSTVKSMDMPAARKGSWEDILHRAGSYNKFILSKDIKDLNDRIGHRAIGVVYYPGSEGGNYVPSILPERYEAFIYIDKSTALTPIKLEQ